MTLGECEHFWSEPKMYWMTEAESQEIWLRQCAFCKAVQASRTKEQDSWHYIDMEVGTII